MTFDDTYNAIRTSIQIGISAEDDGTDESAGEEFVNPLTPLVRSLTEEQVDWIAAWLAGEGFRLPPNRRTR